MFINDTYFIIDMAGLIDLTKGDLDNLKGRCIVYSKLSNQSIGSFQPKEDIVAVYLTNSINDFTKITQSGLEEIARQEQQHIYGAFQVSGVDGKTFNFYMGFVPAISEESILNSNHDVVYVGRYSNEARCRESTWVGARLYLGIVIEQMVQAKGFSKSFKEDLGPTITYKSFKTGKDLEKYICDKYLSVMIYSKEGDHTRFLEDAKNEFTQFMAGYPVKSDITDLFKAIEGGNKNLAEKYVKKIVAVATGQYRVASKLKNEIDAMEKPLSHG